MRLFVPHFFHVVFLYETLDGAREDFQGRPDQWFTLIDMQWCDVMWEYAERRIWYLMGDAPWRKVKSQHSYHTEGCRDHQGFCMYVFERLMNFHSEPWESLISRIVQILHVWVRYRGQGSGATKKRNYLSVCEISACWSAIDNRGIVLDFVPFSVISPPL